MQTVTISCEEYACLLKAEIMVETIKAIYAKCGPYEREKLMNALLGVSEDE